MTSQEKIEAFLASKRFAVVGASQDRTKYGNKVLRVYMQNDLDVVPSIRRRPKSKAFTAYRDLASVPGDDRRRVDHHAAGRHGARRRRRHRTRHQAHLDAARRRKPEGDQGRRRAGANVIASGPCILVSLRYHEHD